MYIPDNARTQLAFAHLYNYSLANMKMNFYSDMMQKSGGIFWLQRFRICRGTNLNKYLKCISTILKMCSLSVKVDTYIN